MAYPVQAPQPSYSGTFIPEIWSKKLIERYYDATVLSVISNTMYEGEIKQQGDTVKIRKSPTLEVRDYVAGQTLQNQRPTEPIIELLIDKGKYWSAIVDDVMSYQSDINLMTMWATDASEQMRIAVDTDVLGSIAPDISTQNKGGTAGRISGSFDLGATGAAVAIDADNVISYLVDHGTVLDEQNCPETGRFAILPAWMIGLMKKSDIKDASLTGDNQSPLRNGRVGMIDRFTVYSSNLLPNVTDSGERCYTIYTGHKNGLAFASQITKTETLRAESTFGDIMRGLQVYGYKVIDGTLLTAGYVYNDA